LGEVGIKITVLVNSIYCRSGFPSAIGEIAILEFASTNVRKFEVAIFENTVFKGNASKFNGIENAVRENHLLVGAQLDAGACKGLRGNDEQS
jgi:hypothetical protein